MGNMSQSELSRVRGELSQLKRQQRDIMAARNEMIHAVLTGTNRRGDESTYDVLIDMCDVLSFAYASRYDDSADVVEIHVILTRDDMTLLNVDVAGSFDLCAELADVVITTTSK